MTQDREEGIEYVTAEELPDGRIRYGIVTYDKKQLLEDLRRAKQEQLGDEK